MDMTSPAQILRDHGLHVTSPRVAVIGVVTSHPHATADEIHTAVHERLGTVSRQAVYDTVATLSEHGILRRIQPSHSPARYEARTGDNHHHVVCRSCGRVADVDCAVGYRPCLSASEDHGYRIEEAEVIYWGTCPTCLTDATTFGHHSASTTPTPTT